ncbi:hypothetical protein E2C01_097230 [Portunus trituberculatus]|uniref:Uncharacterized protein n=1 Tax=Portunus trituberculatus TaxID=210409 RepID=A0A5B7JXS8_PORTR|nr:hypothetical protein [Portunus trituberculatus]
MFVFPHNRSPVPDVSRQCLCTPTLNGEGKWSTASHHALHNRLINEPRIHLGNSACRAEEQENHPCALFVSCYIVYSRSYSVG